MNVKSASAAKPLTPPRPQASSRNSALLVVTVPTDATVYLVNQKMSVTGTERRFRVSIADPTREYTYPIRVEVIRNGKTLVSETTQKLRGGQQFKVAVTNSDEAGELVAIAVR